jgi:DNA-directed RNA polymerase specialized sigma24 family protein
MIYTRLISFEHYFNANKKNIQLICSSICTRTDHRIEYEDLYQEAILKLLQNYKDNKPLDINYTLRSIINHLKDYLKKNLKGKKGKPISIEMVNYLYSLRMPDYKGE